MFVIIGYLIVLGAVFGGYALEGGSFKVLMQPIEVLTIAGAAGGAFVVSNSTKVLGATVKALPKLLQGSKYTKTRYMALMALLYDILSKIRKEGMMAIESDIDDPHKSALFNKHPTIASDHHLIEFITDYLRMMVSGNMNPFEIESLMEQEIETHHHEAMAPSHALQKAGDGLPAFGIVAAVMGVVKTMASVGKPPAVLGEMIAAALVGTLPGDPAVLRLHRSAGRIARAEGRRGHQGTQLRQGHAAGEPAGLCAGAGGRIRPQDPVLHGAADVHGT